MTTIDLEYKVQPVHIDIRNEPAHCCLVEGEIDRESLSTTISRILCKIMNIRREPLKWIIKP